MLFNYLTTAFRNFSKNKSFTLINVLGLGLGLMCCLVLYTILRHELTFDTFHPNKQSIYRVVRDVQGENGMTFSSMLPNAMGMSLLENKSLIRDVIPLHGPNSSTIEVAYNKQNKIFKERNNILFATSSFLTQLNFPIIQGADPAILDEPNKVYLTKKMAEKYFGDDNPIGNYIIYDEKHRLEVVGILENTPTNTNTPFQLLVSYSTFYEINNDWIKSWGSYSDASTYILVAPEDNLLQLESEISDVTSRHMDEYTRERTTFRLQPLLDIHTNERYGSNSTYILPSQVLYGSIVLVAIILLVSILNFINLATAQAIRRSREVGIRKTLGGSRKQLIFQFLGETLILVILASVLAFTLGEVFIDKINGFVQGVSFEIGYDPYIFLFAIPLIVVTTLLAGFYPAVILANYNPIMAIRNQIGLSGASGKFSLRKGMVITQFTIANLLIIVTIIVSAQMNFVRTTDLGFDQSDVYSIQLPERMLEKVELLKSDYRQLSYVEEVSWCLAPPLGSSNWSGSYEVIGKPQTESMGSNVKLVDESYLDLYKIPLIAGRNLSSTYYSDTTFQIVVNESFLKSAELHPDSVLGTRIAIFSDWEGEIVGVVEDYNVYSLQQPMSPVMMVYYPDGMFQLNLKLRSDQIATFHTDLERVFKLHGPNELFEISKLSDDLAKFYRLESTIFSAFQVFSVMAILIGIFGMFGLVSFMSAINRKNIGIRKIFGAGVAQILRIFSKEYVILLSISFVIAAPLAYLVAREWLNSFAYRIEITALYFGASFLVILLITILTAGYKSYRAAVANPVESLKYE